MHLNMLFSLLCFTTFLHASLGLVIPNETLVNNAIVQHRQPLDKSHDP